VHTDELALALARALNACFVVRGAQLAVIRRLDSEHVVDVHTSSISWVIDRLSANGSTSKKGKRAVLFFRLLQQLLSTVDSRDALKM
jgi:cohesin complex subunit SA-1/2